MRLLADLSELMTRRADVVGKLAADNGGSVPTVYSDKFKVHLVPISDVVACRGCQLIVVRAAARAPSWVVVDIDNGPGPDRPIVQVPR